MSPFAHITGWGMAVPEKVLTNDDLAKMVDTNDEWIRSRTGIHERHIAEDGQTTATLAVEAALRALEVAQLRPHDLDLVIVATSSPEHIFPATASLVQDSLGAVRAGAFDILAACTGFIFALNMATQAISTGSIENALVIGAETLSRIVNWEDRNTCILFGDGAGAFVLQSSPERGGVISAVMRSDGSGGDLLSLPAGGSRLPASEETIRQGLHFMQMNGREVFRFASRVMVQATQDALEKAGLQIEDVQMIVPHQANRRILEAAIRGLKISPKNCFINLEHYGNTSTASIPIATCEAIEQGRIKPGDHVVFVGFGAGLTWGAAAALWSGPIPGMRKALPFWYRLYARFRSFTQRLVRRIDAIVWGRHNPYT